MNLEEFYHRPAVWARIVEFLGGRSLQEATAAFIKRCDTTPAGDFVMYEPTRLAELTRRGLDISRSLWDHESLLAHLDVEYVNFDFAAEAYLDPARMLNLQKSTELEIERMFIAHGIAPLHLLSGRGHHFLWRIKRDSAAYRRLAEIGHFPRHMRQFYARPLSPSLDPITPDLGAAFFGLALVMEYVAHCVKQAAEANARIPIELSAVLVAPQERGREMVSIDITEYGDPLNTRIIRIPFTIYGKPFQEDGLLHDGIRGRVPAMFLIPLHEIDANQGISVMRDIGATAELAGRASVSIPDQSKPACDLIKAYSESDLARFHAHFYSQEHEPPERWVDTYDRMPAQSFPACIRKILETPNDLLLKPFGIRQVVRALTARDWHPRHIAGLVRSKFERNYGWGSYWYNYDAATRADFYVRMFAGLLDQGLDRLDNFECSSFADRQFGHICQGECDLRFFRDKLAQRRAA